jgi:hypothetical protein
MSVVFGRRTMTEDADVEALFHTIDLFLGNQVPGKWIVDGYPVLAKIPKALQWWRPYGEQCYRETVGYTRSLISLTIVYIEVSIRCSRMVWRRGIRKIVSRLNFLLWRMILDLIRINRCLSLGRSLKLVRPPSLLYFVRWLMCRI